ncbi:DUF6152 family protein [Pseudoduganella sp. SL102]|uniref:Uncharacterized protein n=1 Tax=Pseudoduganella albidiflava TaxID=321983 RepID=A0A411WUH2_9BURK|nr:MULTISPECIES: DUF6152 family protein [Pseudoduganella]QBI00415.1 hypothetical protein EYF70_05790 [Pseudoduganella albidiflava]WBS01525.1 DUF6152 family protein [Pseudoduganella sp. SL102]GGY53730.1 hypothetical protein GCM10007387_40240 [Pseudoduganella albidiflava]
MKRSLVVAHVLALAMGAAASAFAHHGWSEYNADKPLTLTGTIAESGYSQPHGYVALKAADKTWHVVLAPPSRMESRGLPKQSLASGAQATVYGYPHRSKDGELRAERITLAVDSKEKTVELR